MKKNFLLPLLILFLFSIGTFAQAHEPHKKLEETKKSLEKQGRKSEVIYVRGDGIARKRVVIDKGTSIIWYNFSVYPMNITFERIYGPQVSCEIPINFSQQKGGSYKAEKISPEDLASLCLIEPGIFHYEVSGIPHGLLRGGPEYIFGGFKHDFEGIVIVK